MLRILEPCVWCSIYCIYVISSHICRLHLTIMCSRQKLFNSDKNNGSSPSGCVYRSPLNRNRQLIRILKMELFSVIAMLILLLVVYKLLDYLWRLPTIGQCSEQYILVTGCWSGFGKGFVHRLDELGCHVFAGCSKETRRLELANTCSEGIKTMVLDVSKHDSVL